MRIVKLDRLLKKKFSLSGKIEIYREREGEVYFYLEEVERDFYLFRYRNCQEEVDLVRKLDLGQDYGKAHLDLLFMGEEDLVFTVYGQKDLDLYSFKAGELSSMSLEKMDNILALNSRYYLALAYLDQGEQCFLLDIEEARSYELVSPALKDSIFDNTRLVDLGKRTYLAHTKYSIDSYDLDYYFKYSDFKNYPSAVYLFDFEKFLEEVKAGREISYRTVYEGDEKTYINSIVYDFSLEREEYNESYHFLVYKEGALEVYYIDENLEALVETKVDLSDYSDYDGIYGSNLPVKLEKITDRFGYKEYRQFYPEDFSLKILNKREDFELRTEDYILVSGWEEDRGYYADYVKLLDQAGDFMKLRGTVRVLEDGESLLVYNDYSIWTRSLILEEGEFFTDMKKVLEDLGEEARKYNYLITDFEIACEKDQVYEKISCQDYLFMSFEEVYELLSEDQIQWINGVFTAIRKETLVDDFQELPRLDYDQYFKEKPILQHSYSDFELVSHDSTALFIVSENRKILESFKKNNPKALDLGLKYRIIEEEVDYIKDILMEEGLVMDQDQARIEGRRIWYDDYRAIYNRPDLDIDRTCILEKYAERYKISK